MATSMPVPLEFRLPDGWTPARPDAVGAPGAAFVALHNASQGPGFTTNITIDGEQRTGAAPLTEIADESISKLEQANALVSVRQRSDFGSADAPGMTQVLTVSTVVEGKVQKLAQCQVYLSMSDVGNPLRRAVVRLVLTATEDRFEAVLPGFQEFVASVRPKNVGANGN
jgi:hypothetical protein